MRILHITDSYGFTGGIQSYLKHVTCMMRELGHEIEIYSPPESRSTIRSHLTRWLSYSDYSQVKKLIARQRPDILHAHSVTMNISPLPFLAASESEIPVIMTVHDFNYACPRKWMIYSDDGDVCKYGFSWRCLISNCISSKNGWANIPYHNLRWLKIALHRWMLKRYVQEFITPSNILGEWMRRSLAVEQVTHIPNFIPGKRSCNTTLQNYNEILFIGRLSQEKGVDILLQAVVKVFSVVPDSKLTVVGDGPQKKELEELSQQLGIHKKVHFEGMVDNEKLTDYYLRASVCVIPSVWMENCPVSALEALAHGRPLVGSDIGGLPELIMDGETGFIVKPNDVDDLAGKLVQLLTDKKMLQDFSQASRERFLEYYTDVKHNEALTELYNRAIR
jgi:glycosyltransferase involved in cell wall biosynthesis